MLKLILLIGVFLMFAEYTSVYSQTLWLGPPVLFSKVDYANPDLKANQDSITESVSITRDNNMGIFNPVLESGFDRDDRTSPAGTRWANGSLSYGIENLEFTDWTSTKTGQSKGEVGLRKVLHVIKEDIYIDVMFTSWTSGGGGSGTGFGGGFSYERSTPSSSSLQTVSSSNSTDCFISGDYLICESWQSINSIKVFNLLGAIVHHSTTDLYNSGGIIFENLPPGIYFVLINNNSMLKMVITG
jgi:hypothetical protein